MSVIFAPEALADLASIRGFISREKPSAAARMSARLLSTCDRIALFPETGRQGPQPGTREVTSVRPYLIVYKPVEHGVEIVRIWHSAQDR